MAWNGSGWTHGDCTLIIGESRFILGRVVVSRVCHLGTNLECVHSTNLYAQSLSSTHLLVSPHRRRTSFVARATVRHRSCSKRYLYDELVYVAGGLIAWRTTYCPMTQNCPKFKEASTTDCGFRRFDFALI